MCYDCKNIIKGTHDMKVIIKQSFLTDRDNEIDRLNHELERVSNEKAAAKNSAKVEHAKKLDEMNKKISLLDKQLQAEKSTTSRLRKDLNKHKNAKAQFQ